jgi:hypothetical protein
MSHEFDVTPVPYTASESKTSPTQIMPAQTLADRCTNDRAYRSISSEQVYTGAHEMLTARLRDCEKKVGREGTYVPSILSPSKLYSSTKFRIHTLYPRMTIRPSVRTSGKAALVSLIQQSCSLALYFLIDEAIRIILCPNFKSPIVYNVSVSISQMKAYCVLKGMLTILWVE